MFWMAKLFTLRGFTKGVSDDVNDVLVYNPPYVQSDFTCNLGLTVKMNYTKIGVHLKTDISSEETSFIDASASPLRPVWPD